MAYLLGMKTTTKTATKTAPAIQDSWDRLMNGSLESQASSDPGDFKVYVTAEIVHSCGSRSSLTLVRERGTFRVLHGWGSESFPSKRAALATYPALAAALAA